MVQRYRQARDNIWYSGTHRPVTIYVTAVQTGPVTIYGTAVQTDPVTIYGTAVQTGP